MPAFHRLFPFLLVVLLITGCQSSRPAFHFDFRPAPALPTSAAAPDSRAAPLISHKIASSAAGRPPRPAAGPGQLQSTFGARALPAVVRRTPTAALSRPARRGSTAEQALRLSDRGRTAATADPLRRSGRRQNPSYVDGGVIPLLLILAGLTSLVLLLVALLSMSGILALIGLGLLLLALLTFNMLWDNHWSFG